MTTYVYSPRYGPEWPDHVFPTEKYRLVAERLKAIGEALVEPEPATREQILLVHTREYLDRLDAMTSTPALGYFEFEVPCSRQVVDAFRYAAGGSILAGRLALREGAAGNVGGGFHHAFAAHGEGFCILNDLAIMIRVLQKEGLIRRAAVIDLDLHQGNGTAHIFRSDPDVYTFSMHQENNYPVKQRSTWDIGLDDFTGDDEYLKRLRDAMPKILDGHKPDLVVYQAGADCYKEDKLGLLKLTIEGIAERDRIVYRESRARGLPVAATLGGGYPAKTEDVVTIHFNTLKLLVET
ncbi:MAG: histone deacetylase [Planctomycetes bacterium]|nr:histone deacetylase [Planctomycetota bacterium]